MDQRRGASVPVTHFTSKHGFGLEQNKVSKRTMTGMILQHFIFPPAQSGRRWIRKQTAGPQMATPPAETNESKII